MYIYIYILKRVNNINIYSMCVANLYQFVNTVLFTGDDGIDRAL